MSLPIDEARAARAVRIGIPSFPVRSVKLLGDGVDARAFVVNGDTVFRFSKSRSASRKLRLHFDVLRALSRRVSLAIPNPEYLCRVPGSSLYFEGYRKVPGTLLSDAEILKLAKGDRKSFLAQLAGFLRELWSFPPAEARAAGLEAEDYREFYASDFAWLGTRKAPRLDQETRAYLQRLHRIFYTRPEFHQYEPALLHGDLSPCHLAYARRVRKLVGVIDFGYMDLGDPAAELMNLYDHLGREFVEELVRLLRPRDRRHFWAKLMAHRELNAVNFLVWAQDQRKDAAKVEEAIVKLRKLAGESVWMRRY